jgi:hypothetical protein
MISVSPTCTRSLDLVAFAVILAIAVPGFGQSDGGAEAGPTIHPFAFGFSGGDSAAPETRVYDVRIPASFKVFSADDDDWGLRLRLILYAGVYNFTVEEATDLDLRFQSLAATPGVEFLLPVGGGWILKPFAEIGYGRDFDNALDFGVWSVGMRTIATWPVKKFHLSFGTKIQYLSTFAGDFELADEFGEIRLGFDARHPLPFTLGGSRGDLSLFVIRRQYIDAFIGRENLDPLEISYTNEIGFTFGTTPKIKLWIVKLPRIGIGYRWGPNSKGVRLNFGFPF